MSLSEYHDRRARLGFAPAPAQAKVFLSLVGYAVPAGPPNLTSSYDKAKFIVAGMVRFYDISVAELKSERRNSEFIPARFEAMYLIKESTPWSFPEIGKFFGGRDQCTVRNAIKKHQRRVAGAGPLDP